VLAVSYPPHRVRTPGMTTVEIRPLGATGLRVSRIGLGLAALGRPGYMTLGHAEDLQGNYDVAAMYARAAAVLDAAWDAGVRYVDTARSYGRGEEFLSRWLASREIAPPAVVVGSKWGYTYTAGWRVDAETHEVKDHSLATLQRQVAESRALLGAQLDLYMIHSATLASGVLDDGAVIGKLAELRARGLKIGLSLTGAKQAETLHRAMAIRVAGARVFDVAEGTWNVLEPSAGPALRAAHDAGLGVIVKEGLANGRLTGRNADPRFAAARRVLDAEATRLHTTIDALALAAILAQPWVDVALSGAATVDQLRSNLTAASVRFDTQAAARLAAIAEEPAVYWTTRSRLSWN